MSGIMKYISDFMGVHGYQKLSLVPEYNEASLFYTVTDKSRRQLSR